MSDYKIKPKCDMLIDQHRYIAGDPVGHACFNEAKYTSGEYFFCEECKMILEHRPNRLTFPVSGSVNTWESTVKRVINKITGGEDE